MSKKQKSAARAEAAARKLREAERLEKEKPVDWSHGVLNPLSARQVRAEVKQLLKAPAHLVGDKHRELVTGADPDEQQSTRHAYFIETLEQPNIIGVAASEQRAEVATEAGVLPGALDAAAAAQASNSLEKMLCHQLAAAHVAAMKLLGRADPDELEPNELVRLTNGSARLMDVYQKGCLALQKLKSAGRQHVVVQYQQVNVANSGQAVVAGRASGGSRSRGGTNE